MSAPRPHLRNLLALTLPELVWGFGSALTIEGPMPAAFARHLGAGEGFLGAWALIGALGSAAAMLLTSWYVAPMARKRRFVVIGHAVTGALYLPVALLAAAGAQVGPALAQAGALLGFGLFVLSLGFLMPAWLALIGALYPARQQARVLGLVFALNRIGGILGGLAAERLLRLPWAGTDVWTLLWGLAAASAALGALPFLAIVEPVGTARPRVPLGTYLRGLLAPFARSPALRRFAASDLLAVSGFVTLSFYGHVALRERGLAEHHVGSWIAWAASAQLVAALLVAILGSALRPRHALVAGALSTALAALLAATAVSPAGFAAVAALLGVYLVSRQTCHGPQVMRLAPGGDPTAALALAMACTSVAQGLLPFVAGLLMPVTGFSAVFAAVAGLALLGAAALTFGVSDAPAPDVSSLGGGHAA